jgi:hypothetical protein
MLLHVTVNIEDKRPEIDKALSTIISMTGHGACGLLFSLLNPSNTSSWDGCDYAAG